MQLKELQTGLFELIKNGTTDRSSDYLEMIRHDDHLHIVRKVAFWWRRLHIEEFCTLTTSWLKQQSRMDQEIRSFFCTQKYSPYRKEVGMQFLTYIINSGTGFLRTIAEFELALIKSKLGMKVSLVQHWPFEPYSLLNDLLNSTITSSSLVQGEYLVTICSDFYPEIFQVQTLQSEH